MIKVPKLSIFIITLNEQRCLSSVLERAFELSDDVVVVDSGSTDETRSIAEGFGAKFVYNQWQGYGQQKRYAEELCKNDWVLNLDADEVLSAALISEIKQLFVEDDLRNVAYRIKVATVYPHQLTPRYLADYNSVVRLYRKSECRFRNHETLDAVVVPSAVSVTELKSPCLHYVIENLEHYIFKLNRYTSTQSRVFKRKNILVFILYLTFGFPIEFLRAYLGKRHITGGVYGFLFSLTRAYFRVMKYGKLYEASLNERSVKENGRL